MRRFSCLLVVGLALSACAVPTIRLSTRSITGDVRTYRLTTTAVTTIDVAATRRTDRTELRARSRIEVLGQQADETIIRVTVTPERLMRGTTRISTPPEQSAELALAPDGSVRRIAQVGGLPAELAGSDIENLVPLLGSVLPASRVHVGDQWRTPIAAAQSQTGTSRPGEARGRVSALRIVQGYDCAIVALGARRPITRERTIAGQSIRLTGDEFSTTELAFAFREGFAVRTDTTAEARFTLQSGTFSGGSVTIASKTTLRLLRASASS